MFGCLFFGCRLAPVSDFILFDVWRLCDEEPTHQSFQKVLQVAWASMVSSGSFVWSCFPQDNTYGKKFEMTTRPRKCLNLCYGVLFGVRVESAEQICKLSTCFGSTLDDVERSCRAWELGGFVLNMCQLRVAKTK